MSWMMTTMLILSRAYICRPPVVLSKSRLYHKQLVLFTNKLLVVASVYANVWTVPYLVTCAILQMVILYKDPDGKIFDTSNNGFETTVAVNDTELEKHCTELET